MPVNNVEKCKCKQCHIFKTLDLYPARVKDSPDGQFKKGEPTAVCQSCMEADRTKKARKRKRRPSGASDDGSDGSELPVCSFEDFVAQLTRRRQEDHFHFRARVVTEDKISMAESSEERAKRMAELVRLYTEYRWTYVRKTLKKRTGKLEVLFSCAQSTAREAEPKAPKPDVKSRTTRRMEHFDCNGYLRVTVDSASNEMIVSLDHDQGHIPYLDITIPDRWKDYIEEHAAKQMPGEIWKHIQQEEGRGKCAEEISIPFQVKAVHYYWNCVCQHSWKLDPNPLESARRFFETKGAENGVAMLDVPAVPGTKVVAFQVTDIMHAWAKNTQELAMDSTWGTNRGNFETFAAIAGAEGSGVPLAYVMIQTSKDANAGAKEAILTSFLSELKKLGVEPEYILTDKDWSEINAMRKQRMAKNKQ
ncbi:hypothetical protein NM688_g9206 [Phlebia brevispora]|uniref:Uncharacterized protein n=1 Tax=Phlebia brevispora TaxID=194682 RepID=A0ACC1RIB9_9APHY|nr:hypothetical protein NM688_g9206 [Phlebia brevispora]